jgi:formate hydrogenlyase transcriptional activator
LNVFPIEVPPLRERVADIPLLAHYFVDRYARQSRKVIRGLDTRSIALLSAYSWPGNVRELQNVIERAVIVCQSETLTVDSRWVGRVPGARAAQLLPDELVARERQLIEAALAESSGRISGSRGAAVRLGIPSSTLESKIRSLGIDKRRFKRV